MTTNIVERFDPTLSPETAEILEVLKEAVGRALDRKRRLGEYAVVWVDGRVVTLPPDALPCWSRAPSSAPITASTPYGATPPARAVIASEHSIDQIDTSTRDPR